jgi:hypothetical protein
VNVDPDAKRPGAIVGIDLHWLQSLAMGEGNGGSLRVADLEGNSADSIDPVGHGMDVATPVFDAAGRSELDAGRRRFTLAVLTAMALTAVPFVWILWVLWGPLNPLRPSVYQDNFYDLQTRAMFHGHLSLASGSLGIEGFVHAGRTYTYFGLFPSIIRMPILLVTSSLDGKLTATSILLAWLLTGLFASMLLWRVRFLVRGDSVMGRAEATGFGVLMATVMGGTIWMLLAATPFVFNEDLAWSVCLTVGSIFALLGVIERPSWGRVIASGVLILCANLDRSTTGWACVVGAGLIAVWFLLGLGGRENRRWCLPVLGAGLVPLAIGCAVNYSKFGVLFGVSNVDQVWTHVNAYRRRFLAANHGAEEGTIFVPTNVLTYFRPDGLRLTSVFPFVTLPASPPTALNGVLFDRLYRTGSLPASTPLLFLLSIWGLVTAFRPKSIGKVARTRLLLLAAGSAGAARMLWGYIAPRYLGDFVPFLVLASAVAMADIFRRLEGRKPSPRVGAVAAMAVVALFSIAANVGMAIVPNEEWDTTQVLNYVAAQKTISDFTGHPLEANVVRGNSLPTWGPAGQLYVIGDCDGLYISNGENFSTVPSEQFQRNTWMTVELGEAFQHTFRVVAKNSQSGGAVSVPLVSAGKYTVSVSATPTVDPNLVRLAFGLTGSGQPMYGYSFEVSAGATHTVVVTTDPVKHVLEVTMDGEFHLGRTLFDDAEPIRVDSANSHSQGTRPALSVTDETATASQPTLCEGLIH